MGRPLNKRFFGADANNNIRIQFFNGTASVPGYIVKQKGSKTFLCSDYSGVQAICRLVDKDAASLLADEMSMTILTDAADGGLVEQVTKITAHRITAGGVSYPWNFAADAADGKAQMEEAGTSTVADTGSIDLDVVVPVIAISLQPAPSSVTAPAATSFSVTAAAVPVTPLTYQWEVSTDGGTIWADATGGVYTNDTTATLDISDSTGLDTFQYRVVISAAGATDVTSDPALLTVA